MIWWVATLSSAVAAAMSVWIGSTVMFLIFTAAALFAASQLPGRRK